MIERDAVKARGCAAVVVVAGVIAACARGEPSTPLTQSSVDAGRLDASATNDGAAAAAAALTDQLYDLVITEADCKKEPRKDISRADAFADVAAVARIVRRGWAGFETMSAAGVNFDAVFTDLERSIAAMPEPIDVEAFQARLVEALHPAADNHMAFFAFNAKGQHTKRKSVGKHQRAFTADVTFIDPPPGKSQAGVVLRNSAAKVVLSSGSATTPPGAALLSCTDQLRPTIVAPASDTSNAALTPGYRFIVLAESPPPPLKCLFRIGSSQEEKEIELPMRLLKLDASANKNAPAFELRERDLPVIKLRSMWSGKLTDLEAFVESAARVRDAKGIVVDVRGNGGGADFYGKRWFASLTTDKLASSVVDRLDSEVTRQGVYNDNLCELVAGIDDEGARKETQARLDFARIVLDTGQRAGQLFRAWRTRTTSDDPKTDKDSKASKPFKAPLVVLTDHQCASACETFLTMVKDVEHGIVVGENSGGVGVFGEVLVYRLPKSGLGMSAGMKHFHSTDPKRDIPEGRGYLPDLWLDTDDALGLSTRIATCLAKPNCPLTKSLSLVR